jgi:DNA-binding NarL/FixJ family response regulator
MTTSPPRDTRIILIDDHEIFRRVEPNHWPGLYVVETFANTEAFLRSPTDEYDVIVLDVILNRLAPNLPEPAGGTRAIRKLINAGCEPVVLYTGIVADAVLAGCLAAGARGAVSKNNESRFELGRVVSAVAAGKLEIDSLIASALRRLETGRHAGGLSAQQSEVIRLCAIGMSQDRIAEEIGVSSRKTVENYLHTAIAKLAQSIEHGGYGVLSEGAAGIVAAREAAAALGLDDGLVRWKDIEEARRIANAPARTRTARAAPTDHSRR